MYASAHGYDAYVEVLGNKYPLTDFPSRALTYGPSVPELGGDGDETCVILPEPTRDDEDHLAWLQSTAKMGPAHVRFVKGRSLVDGMRTDPSIVRMLREASRIEFFRPEEHLEGKLLCEAGITWDDKVNSSYPTLAALLNRKIDQRRLLAGLGGDKHWGTRFFLPYRVCPADYDAVLGAVAQLKESKETPGNPMTQWAFKGDDAASGAKQLYVDDMGDSHQLERLREFLLGIAKNGASRIIVEQAFMDTSTHVPASVCYLLDVKQGVKLLHVSRQGCGFKDMRVVWDSNTIAYPNDEFLDLEKIEIAHLREWTAPAASALYAIGARGYIVFDVLINKTSGFQHLLEINARPTFSLFGLRSLQQVLTNPQWAGAEEGAVTIKEFYPKQGSPLRSFHDVKNQLGDMMFDGVNPGVIPHLVGGLKHAGTPMMNLVAVDKDSVKSKALADRATARLHEATE
ncbi:MAG: hypothetical protein ABIH21_05565 [Patescibacteria group bacterium]